MPNPAASRAYRLDHVVYLFILLEACVFWLFHPYVEDIAPDSSTYQGLARSLAHSGSYQFNFAPHIQYPPGLPLLLAGIGSVFGEDHCVYLRAMTVFSMFALLATYGFLKQEHGRVAAAAATLLLGSSGYFFIYSAVVLNSDIPYLFTSITALILGKHLDESKSLPQTLALSIAFGLLLLFSVLLRSVGMAFVGGYCLWVALSWLRSRELLLARLVRFGAPLALGLAAQVAWWLYVREVKPLALPAWGDDYTDVFKLLDPHRPELGRASAVDFLLRIPRNLVQHSAHLFELASGMEWIEEAWYSPFVLLTMGLVGVGFLHSAYKWRGGVIECYFLLYAAIYALWPYDVGARFVLPVFPIAFLYAWRATGLLWQAALQHPREFVLCAFALSAAVGVTSLAANLGGAQPSLQTRLSLLFWLASSLVFGVAGYAQFRGSPAWERGIGLLGRPVPSCRWPALSLAQGIGVLLVLAVAGRGLASQTDTVLNISRKISMLEIVHAASVEAAKWLGRHSQESDRVMAQQIAVVHYVSGRRIVGFPATNNPRQIMDAIRRGGVKFLVVTTSNTGSNVKPSEADRLQALKTAYADSLRLIHAGSGYQVFQIVGVDSQGAQP